jgi:hypothetical protein
MKKLHAAATLAAAIALPVATALPASAHPADAYHGNRGHAWTNTAHTRVGVEDTRCDGFQVWAVARTNNLGDLQLPDLSDCGGGPTRYVLPTGTKVLALRVCAETRGCGNWVWA